MMQVPSSSSNHYNYQHSKPHRGASKRSARPVAARWLDGWLDKACLCATPAGYAVGDEVDDTSIAYTKSSQYNIDNDDDDDDYSLCDNRQDNIMAGKSTTRRGSSYYPEFISNPSPSRRSNRRDAASVVFQEAENTIHWSNTLTSCGKSYQTVDMPNSPVHSSSGGTALTAQSSQSSTGNSTDEAYGNREWHGDLAQPIPYEERAHSTGTMRHPEDDYGPQCHSPTTSSSSHDRQLSHAHSIHSSVTLTTGTTTRRHYHSNSKKTLGHQRSGSSLGASFPVQRTTSETLPKLPFATLKR